MDAVVMATLIGSVFRIRTHPRSCLPAAWPDPVGRRMSRLVATGNRIRRGSSLPLSKDTVVIRWLIGNRMIQRNIFLACGLREAIIHVYTVVLKKKI